MSDFLNAIGESTVRALKWLTTPLQAEQASEEETIAELERSLAAKQRQLENLAPMTDRVQSETNEIAQQHQSKQLHHRELILKILHAKQSGHIDEARLLMTKAVHVERILPELQARWERSQQRLNELVEFQERKQAEISLLSFDLKVVKTQIEINRSLDRHLQTAPDLAILFGKVQQLGDCTEELYQELQTLNQFDLTANYAPDSLNLDDLDQRIDQIEVDHRHQGFSK